MFFIKPQIFVPQIIKASQSVYIAKVSQTFRIYPRNILREKYLILKILTHEKNVTLWCSTCL